MLTGAWSDSAVASVNSFPGGKVYFFILSPPSDCLRKSKCKGRDEGGVFILESLLHFLWAENWTWIDADSISIYFVSRTAGLSRARIKVLLFIQWKKEDSYNLFSSPHWWLWLLGQWLSDTLELFPHLNKPCDPLVLRMLRVGWVVGLRHWVILYLPLSSTGALVDTFGGF